MIQNIKSLLSKTFAGKASTKTILLTLAVGASLGYMIMAQTVAGVLVALAAILALIFVAVKDGDMLALTNMSCMANVTSFGIAVLTLIKNVRNGNGVGTFFSSMDVLNTTLRAESLNREYVSC